MTKKRPFANSIGSRQARIGICVFLVAITWLVFGQTLRHGFINYDDPVYVYENPVVRSGLTLHGIGWAFTHSHGANWHPLTSISHMLDSQFYGLKAGGHHFTNVLLHTIAVLLLFALLLQMTGALWRSGFVAAVFAIHPLHVESVAWVAERKDVLSGVLFMLTLLAYVRYARSPSLGRYATMLVLFACGLMAKPMLVTIPFVLLLLDYWPLSRFAQSSPMESRAVRWRLILEKVPLLALSAASCIATLLVQGQAIGSVKHFPLGLRADNALVTCMTYIWQMIWPAGLAPFYPYPGSRMLLWEVIFASAALVVITSVAFAFRKTRPYLMTGWFWYLGMLVPVIGVIQVGLQGHADRYTYLPQIGLYLLMTWTIAELSVSWRHQRQILAVAAALVIAALTWQTWNQTSYWHDSESLWRHALAVNSEADVPHGTLADTLFSQGRVEEAIPHFQAVLQFGHESPENQSHLGVALLRVGRTEEAIRHLRRVLEMDSAYIEGHYNLGTALLQNGELNEAIDHFQRELQIEPDLADAHFNLGNAFLMQGRVDEAIGEYKKVLQVQPRKLTAYLNLSSALLREGQWDEAVASSEKALELEPANPDAHNNLALALAKKGRTREAIFHWQKALEIQPDKVGSQVSLARVLATSPDDSIRDGVRAVNLAEQAFKLSGGRSPAILQTLAAAYAETGQFARAVETVRRALELTTAQGNTPLAEALQKEIALYQAGSPYRETPK